MGYLLLLSISPVKGALLSQEQDMRATLTVKECSEQLGISAAKLYEICRSGQFPHLRLGRRIVIPKQMFERFLEASSTLKTP